MKVMQNHSPMKYSFLKNITLELRKRENIQHGTSLLDVTLPIYFETID